MTLRKSWGKTMGVLALALLACLCAAPRVAASGSRDLYPASDDGRTNAARANLEWRTDTYGGLLLRRTLLHVYAHTGEYILVSSSAVGVGSGDILIYRPGRVSGPVGSETVPGTPDFQATSQTGKGQITSRALELAGPQSQDGTGNTSGYAPASYIAPEDGIYEVIFYGPAGGNTAGSGTAYGDITLASANDFNTSQGSSVAAWMSRCALRRPPRPTSPGASSPTTWRYSPAATGAAFTATCMP